MSEHRHAVAVAALDSAVHKLLKLIWHDAPRRGTRQAQLHLAIRFAKFRHLTHQLLVVVWRHQLAEFKSQRVAKLTGQ